MRGVYQVVPYMSCVEIIGTRWGDEAQTLTLFVQGLGYLVGALPSGKLYTHQGTLMGKTKHEGHKATTRELGGGGGG